MSRPRLVLSIAIAGLLAGTSIAGVSSLPLLGAAPAYAQQATLSFSVFFDKLQQGHWVRHPQYKYVWCPEVDRTWSPYTNGHWVYLENRGWYFASDEPFAWAVYHYGRWLQDADLGWCWVPGNVWAPAWVSWRRSSDYVGWAPLPPEGSGFAIGTTISTTEVPQDRWRFVPIRGFLQPQLSTEIVTVDKHPDVFQRSKPAGAVVVQNNIVVNTVINVNVIEQATKKRVPVVKTRTVDDPTQVGRSGQSDVISVFSAKLEAPKQDAAPKQVEDKAQAAQQLHNQPAGAAGATPQAGAAGAAGANAAGANASSTTTSNTTTSNKTTSGNDASGAATSPAKPAATSNSTTTPAPSGSAAAKGGNGSAPAGAGETCAPNEKVNGKCPPTDNGKKKPTAATAAPAAQPGTPSGQQKGSSAGSSAAQKGAAGATGNNDQGTSGKPGRAATQAPTPAAKPQQPSRGQGAAPKGCAADQMVNGACPPAGNASGAGKGAAGDKSGNGASSGQSSGASSSSTARHNNDQNAPAAGRGAAANGPASQGGASQQKPPAKGKGQAVCPPNEVMDNGSCAPKGGAEPKTNDAPKQ